MKNIKNIAKTVILLILCTCCTVSCGKQNINNSITNDQNIFHGNKLEESEKDVHVSGTVISVTYNSDGIADFTILSENDSVCRILPAKISQNGVSVGQKVLITVEGSVMESDPMQAIAKSIDITEEFNKMPLPVETYAVYNITASKVSEALTSSGYRFYRFTTYEECLDFLKENELSEEFQKTVGNTDITALTNTFFEKNDLGLFIVNSADEQGNLVSGVYHSNGTLYLGIDRTSQNTVMENTVFDAFLLPLNKMTEVTQGIVLTEHYLKPSKGEEQGKDDENETVQTISEKETPR